MIVRKATGPRLDDFLELSEKQKRLIRFHAKRASLDYQMVLDRVQGGKCNITDLQRGILGRSVPTDEAYLADGYDREREATEE